MHKIEIILTDINGLSRSFEIELPADENIGPPIVYVPGVKTMYFYRVEFSRRYVETVPVGLNIK